MTMRGRLKIPLKLAVVVLAGGLAGCPGSGSPNDPQQSSLCPPDYFCTTDAARAFNCTDGAQTDPIDSVTDLGSCYAPV